ncbi:hypothetical protein DEM26_05650 [Thioclava sp. NG1]|uniref:hypothetical protein n=1 Tax=Thioclava sp. NG1 TaxID=2182426 RepID=UPI000D621453|nr:hypothetical protein [Thioclava sp. NG1]PWE50410.1 hypothetical protein DEM26_05650 [Thioclava sp. NG1]
MNISSRKSDYQYGLEDCDVLDRDSLKAFRAKRDEWLYWLEHDEHHAISKQITGMLWSDAVFRLINESRKFAHEAGDGYSTQSGIIASSLDRGYVAEQVISFRKLMEKGARDPEKQVISLRRLIDDIRKNRHLLTREMFVCHDGLPYDCDCGIEELPEPNENGVSFGYLDTRGPRAFYMSRLMHEAFDRMMEKAPAKRGRKDRIGDAFFQEIEDALSAAPFDELRQHANKILLHAADEFSRGKRSGGGITLDNVWICHKAILMVANRVSVAIGGSNIGAVPTPQFDVLENWSAPFAPEAKFEELLNQWRKENDLREDWCQELFRT